MVVAAVVPTIEYVVRDEDEDEMGSGFGAASDNGDVGSWAVGEVSGGNGVARAQKKVLNSVTRIVLDGLLPAEMYWMEEERGDADDEKLEDEVWGKVVDALAMAAAGGKPVAVPPDIVDDGVLDGLIDMTSDEILEEEVRGWEIGCWDGVQDVQDDLQSGHENGAWDGVQSHEEDKNCKAQVQALIRVSPILILGSTFLTFSEKD